ncbi:DUF6415 family natural product biosynthesis protein [Streptomyces fradiae]|uniref:DUF6415 family natural product biosynthesis protein n=1 Tax=Streptomyces fradiae TaxID=1906 RepID=UPI0033F548E3
MTTSTLPLSARRRIPVPDRARLTNEQRHGTACAWCAVVLAPETAVSLGHRPYAAPFVDYLLTWWPRGCRACVAARAPLPVDTDTMRTMAQLALGEEELADEDLATLSLMYRGMLRELIPAVRDATDDLPPEDADRSAAEAGVSEALARLDHQPRGPRARAAHTLRLARAVVCLLNHLDRLAQERPDPSHDLRPARGGTTRTRREMPTTMTARSLLTDAQFNSVQATILDNNPGMQPDLASRILTDALAFVATAARTPGGGLVPSRVVDEGWHALILHTGLYHQLCTRLGGFVHHLPERPDPSRYTPDSIHRTIAAIEEAGYAVDRDLWRGPDDELVAVAAKCQHSDDSGPIVTMPKPKG